ncbi:hypothetical protein [Ruegeria jejuensis]|uniref:hypothetical protein n=1 Tax=Ruegeria jejuensis TaxID=3233338 RepID=UPI00355B5BBF
MKLLATAAVALLATQVSAQTQNCAPRDVVLDRLSEKYGESRRGIGLVQQGSVMEVFASDDTGTWTITVTLPNGMTCLVASGQSYEGLSEALVDGDPA